MGAKDDRVVVFERRAELKVADMAGGVEKIEAVIHPDNTLRSSPLPLYLERRMKRGVD